MKKCWDQTTEVMFSRLGRRRRGSTLLHLLLCNAVNTLLSGLLRLKRARDYVLDFTKHELCWEDDINKAQTLLSPLLPSFFFTKHFSFSFGVNELEGKIVKASKIPDYTSTHFSLRPNEQPRSLKASPWKTMLTACHFACTSPLSAMEVKHLESLGTGPSGDANEDREVPLTMHARTHTKQHLSVNKRVE